MRVVCDNCGASYKIPDSKLTREVNKATCRKCGNPILIRRPDANPAASTAAPAANTEERTLITSAADLERQVRNRATTSSAYDEGAMDPRPTQISPDNSHTEATVPRDEEAERAAAGFRPLQAPSDAATFVQGAPPSATLIPDLGARGLGAANGGFGAPGFAPSGFGNSGMGPAAPTQQVKGPLPAPATPGVSPQRAAAAYEQPAPPPPFGRAAQQAPGRAPAPTLAPALPPPQVPPRPAASPVSVAPVGAPSLVSPAPAKAAHNPSGDLTFALLLSLVSMLGVLLVIANAALGIGALAVFGTFLALLGSAGTALVVLTGARGTKPASVVLSGAGGFFLAFVAALAQGLVSYTPPSEPLVAAAPPAAAPEPVVAKVVEAPPAPAVDPLAALAGEPVPAPTADVAAVAVSEPAAPAAVPPAPVVSAPAPKAVVATPAPKPTPAPERVTPKPTPAPKATPEPTVAKSTPAPKSTPRVVESEPAPAAKAASLDTRVIDTMIKNNKGVKKCFIVEKGSSGSLPSGVKVKLTVQSSGTVSSARIPSGDFAGTEFDSCVSGAVKSIQFPPFDGDPLTITYPFPL